MISPKLIVALPQNVYDKLLIIADKKGLSASALARTYIKEKIDSIEDI